MTRIAPAHLANVEGREFIIQRYDAWGGEDVIFIVTGQRSQQYAPVAIEEACGHAIVGAKHIPCRIRAGDPAILFIISHTLRSVKNR